MYCQFGVSTNILVQSIKDAGEPDDIVDAFPVGEVNTTADKYDIMLIGPQVCVHAKRLQPIAEKLGMPMMIMDMIAYGRLDGKAIYDAAKKTLEEYRKEHNIQ